jgi:L-asparaginase
MLYRFPLSRALLVALLVGLPDGAAAKPKIHVIGTGGTISGAAPERIHISGYKAGTFKVADMLAEIPELAAIANVTSEQPVNVGSGNIGSKELLAIAKRLNALCAEQPDIDGFVVTHGTSTLEETAYFLDLTVRTEKPIVVVGSMRPWTGISTDAHLNLYNGVRVAACPDSRRKGVLVVLNDEINAAREATKADTLRVETFTSREHGFLGYADPDKVVFYREPVTRHTFKSEFDISRVEQLPRVDIVYGYQDGSRAPVDALAASGVAGIVTSSTSPEMSGALRDAVAKGVKIVSSDRKGSGRVMASATRLKNGTISADNLRPQKARILLQIALTQTQDNAELQRIFNEY